MSLIVIGELRSESGKAYEVKWDRANHDIYASWTWTPNMWNADSPYAAMLKAGWSFIGKANSPSEAMVKAEACLHRHESTNADEIVTKTVVRIFEKLIVGGSASIYEAASETSSITQFFANHLDCAKCPSVLFTLLRSCLELTERQLQSCRFVGPETMRNAAEKYVAYSYIDLGYAHEDIGQWELCIQCLEKSLEKGLIDTKEEPEILQNLGNCYEELGDLLTSISYLRQALAIDPRYLCALFDLGMFSARLSKWEDTISAFEKYLEIEPSGTYADDARTVLARARNEIRK